MNKNNLKSFKDLNVWQKSAELAVVIYKTTEKFPQSEIYGISNQMRRAAVSISSNLAEGFKRIHKKEKLQFYNIAHSSASELESQIEISKKLGFLSDKDCQEQLTAVIEVSKMIDGLIKSFKSLNPQSSILNPCNSGQVLLLTTLLLGSIILSASAFLGFLMVKKLRQSTLSLDSAQAFYASDSGIEYELYRSLKSVEPACPFSSDNQFIGFRTSINPIGDGADGNYGLEIKSTGQSYKAVRSQKDVSSAISQAQYEFLTDPSNSHRGLLETTCPNNLTSL